MLALGIGYSTLLSTSGGAFDDKTNLLDAFLTFVGLIFVCDVDEKVANAWQLTASFYRTKGQKSCQAVDLWIKWICYLLLISLVVNYIGQPLFVDLD